MVRRLMGCSSRCVKAVKRPVLTAAATAWRRCSPCIQHKPTQARTVKTHRFPIIPLVSAFNVNQGINDSVRLSEFLAFPTVFLVFSVVSLSLSSGIMVSGILTASRGLTPHLYLVPSGVKINTNEWLNMVEDFVVPSFGAQLGPGRVLIKDNALSHGEEGARVV